MCRTGKPGPGTTVSMHFADYGVNIKDFVDHTIDTPSQPHIHISNTTKQCSRLGRRRRSGSTPPWKHIGPRSRARGLERQVCFLETDGHAIDIYVLRARTGFIASTTEYDEDPSSAALPLSLDAHQRHCRSHRPRVRSSTRARPISTSMGNRNDNITSKINHPHRHCR